MTKHVLRNEIGQVRIEDVLPYIEHNTTKVFSGIAIKMSSARYFLFRNKGTDCVRCGAKGEYFSITSQNGSHHLNLIALDKDGNKVLMTKDHIIPKSKGGKNTEGNLQPMCVKCNMEKKDN